MGKKKNIFAFFSSSGYNELKVPEQERMGKSLNESVESAK
jgi:hypothetical protein